MIETLKRPAEKIITHPLFIQLFKYGICGVLSTLVFIGVTYLLTTVFSDFVSTSLPQAKRAMNLNILHFLAFLPANIVAYLTNRIFVFTPGKHSQKTEFLIFTGLAFLSFLAGLLFPEFVIRVFNADNKYASAGFIITSAMANFIGRKLLVFKH